MKTYFFSVAHPFDEFGGGLRAEPLAENGIVALAEAGQERNDLTSGVVGAGSATALRSQSNNHVLKVIGEEP